MKKLAENKFQVETGGGYFFPTAEKAEAWENNLKAFWAVEVPQTLTQDEYLNLCQEHEVPVMDLEKSAYGIEYAEIQPSQGWQKMLQYALAERRLSTARAERIASRPIPVTPDYPNGRKLSCGHIVYSQVEIMNASLGSSCLDCYDRMSG